MEATLEPKLMEINPDDENALLPIVVTESGRVIEVSLEQLLNALLLIVVT